MKYVLIFTAIALSACQTTRTPAIALGDWTPAMERNLGPQMDIEDSIDNAVINQWMLETTP